MTNNNDGLDMTGGVDLSDTSNYDAAPGDRTEELDQVENERSLIDRPGVTDPVDEGYSPPEKWSAAEGFGNTAAEMAEGESLDQRLAQEVPDQDEPADHVQAALEDVTPASSHETQVVGDDPATDDFDDLDSSIDDMVVGDGNLGDGEVGDVRAGRLVDPDQGTGEDVDKDMVGSDVGIDNAAASAEEAAVHIVPDDTADY
jgi:hypothetical protein